MNKEMKDFIKQHREAMRIIGILARSIEIDFEYPPNEEINEMEK